MSMAKEPAKAYDFGEVSEATRHSMQGNKRVNTKPEVLVRQNGNPTYFTADIAYHRNKFKIRYLLKIHGVQDSLELRSLPGHQCRRSDHISLHSCLIEKIKL